MTALSTHHGRARDPECTTPSQVPTGAAQWIGQILSKRSAPVNYVVPTGRERTTVLSGLLTVRKLAPRNQHSADSMPPTGPGVPVRSTKLTMPQFQSFPRSNQRNLMTHLLSESAVPPCCMYQTLRAARTVRRCLYRPQPGIPPVFVQARLPTRMKVRCAPAQLTGLRDRSDAYRQLVERFVLRHAADLPAQISSSLFSIGSLPARPGTTSNPVIKSLPWSSGRLPAELGRLSQQ